MWKMNAPSPDYIPAEQRFSLAEDIAAIEEVPSADGKIGLAPVSRITKGAEVEYCGEGFNEQTMKVRWQGTIYFIFREDLPIPAQPKLAARCAYC